MDHVSGTKVGITAELLGACSSNSGETSSGNNGMQTEVIRRGGGVPADLPSPELMFSPPDLDSPVFNMGDNVFFGMLARVNPLCTSISQSHDLSLLELEALKHNKHNPIGRFLTENNLTAQEAQELEVVDYLLQAPRTARTKYGTKKNLTPEQKLAQTKARNKAHAAATRERKKLFKKITNLRAKATSAKSSFSTPINEAERVSAADAASAAVEGKDANSALDIGDRIIADAAAALASIGQGPMDTSEGAVTEEEDSGDLGSNNNIVCATPDSGEIWHMKQLQQQQQQQQQKWQQPHLFLKQPHYQQQKETFSSIEGLSPIMQLADVASELHRFENQRMSAHHQDVSPHDSTNFLSDMMALCPTIRANEYQWQSQPQQAPLSSAHQPHGGGSSSSSCNSSKSSSEGGTGATTNEVDTTTSSIAFSASISAITNTTRATATTLSSPSLSPSISQHSTGKQARSMHCAADNTTGTAADLFSATPTVTIEAGGAATATTAHHCENGVLSCDSTGTASASL